MDRVRQTLQKRGTFVSYLTFRYLIHKDHCFKHWIVYTVSEFCHFIKIPTTCTIIDVETDDEGNIYFQNYDIINIFE